MSTNKRPKKLWYIKRVEYYTAVKKKDIELYTFMQQIQVILGGIKKKKQVENSVCRLDYYLYKKGEGHALKR